MGTLSRPVLHSQNKKWEVENRFDEEIRETKGQIIMMAVGPLSVNTHWKVKVKIKAAANVSVWKQKIDTVRHAKCRLRDTKDTQLERGQFRDKGWPNLNQRGTVRFLKSVRVL